MPDPICLPTRFVDWFAAKIVRKQKSDPAASFERLERLERLEHRVVWFDCACCLLPNQEVALHALPVFQWESSLSKPVPFFSSKSHTLV